VAQQAQEGQRSTTTNQHRPEAVNEAATVLLRPTHNPQVGHGIVHDGRGNDALGSCTLIDISELPVGDDFAMSHPQSQDSGNP
jgi:hypothetical protein